MVALGLLTIGCGDKPPSTPSGTASTPTTAATSAPSQSPAIDYEQLVYGYTYQPLPGVAGGSLTIGDWHSRDQLNPLLAGAVSNRALFGATMRTPFIVTADGHWKPDLAARMPSLEDGTVRMDADGSGFEVDLELRPDLHWSDGQPATMHDLEYTWEYIQGVTPASAATTGWRMIDRISVTDDTHATVHFRQPSADYLAVLGSYFFPEHYYSTFATTDLASAVYPFSSDLAKAVTIGPFKYETASGRDVKLVRDANWHGPAVACPGAACLDSVVYRIFPNDKSGLIKAFNDGSVDVALGLDDTDYGAIADVAANGQAVLGPAWLYEHFDMNEAGGGSGRGHPALRDVVVRRAISQAIDRRALYQAVLASPLPASAGGDLVGCTNATPSNYWRLPDADCLDYDVDAANKALDEAGYKRGADGIRVDPVSGLPLVFEHCTTAAPYREVSGRFFKDAFERIGIKLNLNFLDRDVLLAAAGEVGATAKCNLARGNFDTAEFAYVLGFNLHDNYYYSYHSDQIPTSANGWSGYNFLHLDDQGVDHAIDALSSAISPMDQLNSAYDVQRTYVRDAPEIALYYRDQTRGTPTGLRNFLMHPGAAFGAGTDTWNIEDWWLGD